mgnify:CR=1 FL=1
MFTYIIITRIDCLVNHHFLSYILHTALRWKDIVNIVNIEGIKLSCLSDILRLRILPLLDGWLVELSFCCWLASIFFIALALISNSRSSSFCLFIGLIFAPVIENVNTTYPIEKKTYTWTMNIHSMCRQKCTWLPNFDKRSKRLKFNISQANFDDFFTKNDLADMIINPETSIE